MRKSSRHSGLRRRSPREAAPSNTAPRRWTYRAAGCARPDLAYGSWSGPGGPPFGWLQHAELVAIEVSEDVPPPAVFDDRLAGKQGRAQLLEHAPDLRRKVARSQVEVQSVLPCLSSATCCKSTSMPAPSSGTRL